MTASATRGRWIVNAAPFPGSLRTEMKPSILADDAVHGRQPEPGSLAHPLGREERLEDVRHDLQVDAPPVSLTVRVT